MQAVKHVFAEKGFDGTTTRELAKAAGVSEALLYKHFPSKESLYAAMRDACATGPAFEQFKRLLTLEPSTSSLIALVHFLVTKLVVDSGDDGQEIDRILCRMSMRSLLEDGEFTRTITSHFVKDWIAKFAQCLKAAIKTGDAGESLVPPALRGWFVHDLAVTLMFQHLPKRPVVDYGLPKKELVKHAVWFALRGAGMKETSIRRHYDPKALATLYGGRDVR